MMKRLFVKRFFTALAVTALLSGFALSAVASGPAQRTMILATTTSTQDTGLLDVLIPAFEKRTGYFVRTIAVGSGHAMAMGRRGEADVLLAHSPAAEKKFIAEGSGVNRVIVMNNDFVVVGPPADPANIKGAKNTPEAFRRIAAAGALFLSRGDSSGTHAKENEIWKAAGTSPAGQKWYMETGLGMGHTLNVAAERRGYTLTDRGTWLSLQKKLGLPILMEGDPILLNIYHVIAVNPARWPRVNAEGAQAFSDFLVSGEAQEIIRTFGVQKFGGPLFFPVAGKKEEELGK